MIYDSIGFQGIRAKIQRAIDHADHLNAEITRFGNTYPYAIVKNHDDGHTWVYGITPTQPFSVEWSIILGEMVHNLMSALDNMVYLLACHEQRRDVEGTSFPIDVDSKKYAKKEQRALSSVSAQARAYIKDLQPFVSTAPDSLNLRALHFLWNQDKHRVVQPWGLRIDPVKSLVVTEPPFQRIAFTEKVLHSNLDAFQLWFVSSTQGVVMGGNLSVDVVIEDPSDPGGPVIGTVSGLHQTVADVINHLTVLCLPGRP